MVDTIHLNSAKDVSHMSITKHNCTCSSNEQANNSASLNQATTCCVNKKEQQGSLSSSCSRSTDARSLNEGSTVLKNWDKLFEGSDPWANDSDEAVVAAVKERLLAGGILSPLEAKHCYEKLSFDNLIELSHFITSKIASPHVSLCSITNVKSGHCSQDCKWCAQSMHFMTGADVYDVKSKEQCLEEAKACYEQGIEMFSLVASGRKPSKAEFRKLIEVIDYLKANVPIKLCASLGLVDKEQLDELRAHGIERYHCNLETAPTYFGNLVTRHTIHDKLKTLVAAQEADLDPCSGGIIGMGENALERLELALALRELGVTSIPINVLHPIEGTPLYETPKLTDEEILRTVCIFRLLNPKAHLRFAGGRALLSEEVVNQAIYCGVNAAIVGNLLTTIGSDVANDRARFAKHYHDLPDIPLKASSAS